METPSRAQTDFVDEVVQAGKKKNDVILALWEITIKEKLGEVLDLKAKRLIDGAPCAVVPNIRMDKV